MRPSANVTVDTTSMNRRGAERRTRSLRLFFVCGLGWGLGKGQGNGVLTGERKAMCHKGRRILLEDRMGWRTTRD
jgi:hypothetical protein